MIQSLQQFARYEAYQDSGVEWLGDIPQGWQLLPNKSIFRLKKNLVGKRSAEYVLLSLTLKGLIKRDMENPEGKFPAEFDTYQEVKKGDFVFCLFDVEETPRTVGLSAFDGMITGAYTVFQPLIGYDSKFLYYFYLNLDSKKRLRPLYKGLRNTIPKDSFMSFKTPVPPLIEQTTIANFLDQKTAEIDQAIALKTDLIERLKEYKQITIQHAVTRGLDPNAKMKASGVEWIGDIPEGWEITKVKFVTSKIGSGVTPSGGGTIYLETGIPLLRSQNVHFGKVDLDGVAYISEAMHQNMKNSIVLKNDVLLNITGGSIGRCHYSNFDFEMNVNQHVCIVRANAKINYLFLNLFLKSESGQGQIWQNQQGGGREGLNFAALKNFAIHLPPLAEQAAIVAHIETISAKIDQATDQAQQQINTLTEYKTVLINAAVTGKIKVT